VNQIQKPGNPLSIEAGTITRGLRDAIVFKFILISETETMVYRPLRYEQIMQAGDAYEVRARRMFGGMGVYTGERMFAFLVDNDVALKLCQEHYEEAIAFPGASEMRPEAGADPLREYVKLPKNILDNGEEFLKWVERSAEYVRNRAARLA
jgi:DNA transformation protein and related proteins